MSITSKAQNNHSYQRSVSRYSCKNNSHSQHTSSVCHTKMKDKISILFLCHPSTLCPQKSQTIVTLKVATCISKYKNYGLDQETKNTVMCETYMQVVYQSGLILKWFLYDHQIKRRKQVRLSASISAYVPWLTSEL